MNDLDHFERLGLPRRFALDLREVERQYLARSRALHPDFHQLGATSEQQASLESTARLNEAYGVLRDPFRRAEYLLKLEGGPLASEQKEMPPEFLEEVLELRMAIEELRETEPPDSPARKEMEERLEQRRESMLQKVANDFDRLAASNRGEVLISIRRRLNAIKYIQGLLRDLRA
ncbi:MAG TPA: Fe-S protein assembly co-chaperone HscB [Gemmataceae bacterium]|jgi:molecular chaperone HscB|nr:Fe-S protein assembly co-chaperone HscB [Gemmataceae bacterium]